MTREPEMVQRLEDAAARALNCLREALQPDGSYGAATDDLAGCYKSPYLFAIAGCLREAQRVLDHIQRVFSQSNGDFVTRPSVKSENPAYQEYWAYPNAWIVLAAQKMGRFDVAYPGYRYIDTFFDPALSGYRVENPEVAGPITTDVLTNAHLGLTALACGDLGRARAAGHLLARAAALQPDLASAFYLRLDQHGALITEYAEEAAPFYRVSATEPIQLYFMIGYPMAFLGRLFEATGEESWLTTANTYLAFALSCGSNIRNFHFSHKVAWGAAVLARLTGDAEAMALSRAIAEHLLGIQDPSGLWLAAEPAFVSFDQTAEIAIWLREVAAEWDRA